MMIDEESEKELVTRPNKERLKRETHLLKGLVLQLIAMPAVKLESISLDAVARVALLSAKTMVRTALKRQIKYIVGQMRDCDIDLLQRELYLLTQSHRVYIQKFHEIEQWRDDLLAGNEDLMQELIERFASIDRQHFRQLIRNARKEREQNKAPKMVRLLFHYLKRLQTED